MSRAERAKRVLMVTPNLHFPFGGPPVTILQMAYALKSHGHDVEIAYGSPIDGREKQDTRLTSLMEMGVRIRDFPLPRKNTSIIKWGVSIPLIRFVWQSANDYDLITVHQVWGLAYLVLLSKSIRDKSVQIPHESLTRFDIFKTTNRVTHYLKRFQLAVDQRKRRRVLFSSELERQTSIGFNQLTKTAVAYHPLGSNVHPLISEDRDQTSDTLRIGYIGRLHPKKNVGALISALKHIPEAELIIAGSGELEDHLKQHAISLGVSNRIRWLGFVTGDSKEFFYRNIHLSAVPSTYECFGQSAAEAMIRGVPLMCSSEVGAAERLDEFSCIRCGTDPESIVLALSQFRDFGNEVREQMADRARKIAMNAFSNRQFVETLMTLRGSSE